MSPRATVCKPIRPSKSVVDSDHERCRYIHQFMSLWWGEDGGAHTSSKLSSALPRYPGCNPRSIGRRDVAHIKAQDCAITLKSDGVRYALFLTVRPSSPNSAVALMVDRSWNMFEVEVVAAEDFFCRGTILEGELVWQEPHKDRLVYLVFDAAVVCGSNMLALPFSDRYAAACKCTRLSEDLMSQNDVDDAAVETSTIVLVHYEPAIVMRPKSFVDKLHANHLWCHRADFDHRVDGVIVHVNTDVYGTGVFKWKEHSTIDLRVGADARPPPSTTTTTTTTTAVGPAATHEYHTFDAPLPKHILNRTIMFTPSCVHYSTGNIVEFLVTVDVETICLFAVRLRLDKAHANSTHVVLATIQDVIDDVRVDEL
jgi:hypothetical protein